jgi:catechol 2,3-dioxygenase-like lactoylglutathione lyase family enzyme
MVEDILGVHHVGMGVKNYPAMKEFYEKNLGMTQVWAEFPEIWNAMGEVFRTSTHKFGGLIFGQEAGGILIELISMSIPLPRPIRKDIRYGDLGVNKMTMAVADVDTFFKENRDKIQFCAAPESVNLPGWGEHRFVYMRDPEDNLIELVSGPKVETKDTFGGVRWLGISVTDLERSMAFYQSYAFDTVVIAPHQEYSGKLDGVSGVTGTTVRSCLLANSAGGGMLELYEILKPRGRSIPLNAHWGDFGYLEVCLECKDIFKVAEWSRREGVFYLHSPAVAFDEKEVEMWFQYIYDPDGVPVESIAIMPKK